MQQWVMAAKAGEQQAWNVLHRQYYPALYAHALQLCDTQAAAKDAVQDAFMTAFLKMEQLKEPAAFGGWIKKILVHTCLRLKQKRQHNLTHRELLNEDIWWEDEVSRKLDHITRNNRLHTTLSELPESLRSAVMLRYFSEFGAYEDIAKILSIPIGTVRSRMNQAKLKMEALWQHNGDAGDHIFNESREWNHFYTSTFSDAHRHDHAKDRLLNHLRKDLRIVYTSGKTGEGRELVEKEVQEDRKYGSWMETVNVISSGSVSVVEAKNYNSAEFPDRCPPSAVFVLFRDKSKAARMNIHML
jgi:RNA polymerase sigma factor (sigma-70 family)